MKNEKELSRSRALAAKVIFAAFQILKENGKEMAIRDLLKRIEDKVQFDKWEKDRYEKTGYIRWQSIFHWFSIDCVKAGFLTKKRGIWYLTPEGEEAMKLGPVGLIKSANEAYKLAMAKKKGEGEKEIGEEIEEEAVAEEKSKSIDEIEQLAMQGLETYINSKNPYEFQDLIAALLRGMGYYTPFVAPKGKDGGVDIHAYRDPLGTQSPRIQVQIKHRTNSATVQEIRQLMGLLQKEGDVGIFVSTSGFTPDAKMAARSSHIHVELIDLPRLIGLWQEFYHKLPDSDKSLLPLYPIYFLAPTS